MSVTARVVDLTDVKEGGSFRPRRKPEGDYKAKIVKVADHTSKAGGEGWVLTVMVDGDARSTYPYYLSTDKKQLWKIAGICRAVGLNVSGKRINFNPNKLVNKVLGIALEDDEYEGRMKSSIADVFTVDEVGPSADEDAPDVDTDEDEAPEDEVEIPDDEAIEEEEAEEEPAPKQRRKATAPPAKKAAKPKPEPVEDEDDLDEIDTDDLDD